MGSFMLMRQSPFRVMWSPAAQGAVAICRNNAHKTFIMKNLQDWVKNRQLIPGWKQLEKPQHLIEFEKANRALILGQTTPPPPPAKAPAAVQTTSVAASPPPAVAKAAQATPMATGASPVGIQAFGATVL
jgi:hypothetical protein